MSEGRCPSCGASVRAGAEWCSLCYADLRPPPPPPPPPPPSPVPASAPAPTLAAVAAGPDPLSAPYDAVAGAELSGAPAAETGAAAPTWPCTECGTANPIDDMACGKCGSMFGARFATRTDPSARHDRMMRALVGLGVFLAAIGLVTYLSTPDAPEQPVPDAQVELTQ